MANILLWVGVCVIIAGWLAFGWEAAKRMAAKNELERFPERKKVMLKHRNYCRLTILAGLVLLLVALTL